MPPLKAGTAWSRLNNRSFSLQLALSAVWEFLLPQSGRRNFPNNFLLRSRARRRLAERGAVEVEFVALDDLDVGELLAQRLDEVLRVADDDDVGVLHAEARACELLYLRCGDGLYARDVVVALVEVQAVEGERCDLTHKPLGRLQPAPDAADEGGLARRQLSVRDRLA